MKKRLLQCIGIILGVGALLLFFTKLLMPTWPDWNIDNTVKGVYQDPRNRVQAVFLGMSGVVNGISPMVLYNDPGICAYNIGSPQQPMLASYYWIREIERLHPRTLQTVVLDVSSVFDTHYSYAFAEKSLAYMRFSPVRIEAIRACDEEFEEFHFWDHIFPLTAYHSRWPQLTRTDFRSLSNADNYFYTRGMNVSYDMSAEKMAATSILVPSYQLTKEQNHTPEECIKACDESSLRYFNMIVDFCREKHLDLVLISMPKLEKDLEHDAMRYLADLNGLPFIDFNLPEIQEEIGLNFAFDYVDRLHPNIRGAEKITNYIGSFLKNNYNLQDIRGDRNYSYMEQQEEAWAQLLEGGQLQQCEDLEEYLRIIGKDRYTVFLAVKNDAVSGLSDRDRELLSDAGFTRLADLDENYSYVGIIDRGKVIADAAADSDTDFIIVQGRIGHTGDFVFDGIYNRSAVGASYSPLKGKDLISVISAGTNAGNYASVSIDNEEYSENSDGLNFVVYDNEVRQFVDRAGFNTHTPEKVRTDNRLPAAYAAKLESNKLQTISGFRDYLSEALSIDGSIIFLMSTFREESGFFSSDDIAFLESIGLPETGKIRTQPYAAVIRNGEAAADTSDADHSITVMGSEPFFYLLSNQTGENLVIADKNRWTAEEDSVFILICGEDGNIVIDRRIFR